MKLSCLKPGQSATVKADISDRTLCRLIDMGLSEKNLITCLFSSRSDEIRAYQIDNCCFALRKENSDNITIEVSND